MDRHWDTAPNREPSPPAGSDGSVASRRSFCDYLVRARRQRNMSIDEISGVTRIPVRSLERLESGKFEELPGDVFVRGFLRSYARCVGLNTDEIIRRYTNCGMTPAPVASPMADELASAMATLEDYGNACVRQVIPPPGRARTADPGAPAPGGLAGDAPSPGTSPAAPEHHADGSMPAPPGQVEQVPADTNTEREREAATQAEAGADHDARPRAPRAEAATQAGRSPRKRRRRRKRQRRQATEHHASREVSGSAGEASGAAPSAAGAEPVKGHGPGAPAPEEPSAAPVSGVPAAEQIPAPEQVEDAARASRSGDDAAGGAGDPAGTEPGPAREPGAAVPESAPASPGADQSTGTRAATRPVPAGARGQRGRARTRMPTAATRPVLVIDDEHPEDAERAQEERAARGDSSSWRSLLPPALLDGEEGSNRSTLTLAVIILVIVATLTMSYLLRRPDVSGDGITWQRALPGAALGHDTGAAGASTSV